MNTTIKVAVIGGTGKAGKYLVQQLLKQGFHFKVLVRNPERFKIENPLIEVVHGNVADYETVLTLLKGCDALISTLSLGIPASELTIFSTATKHIIRAMTVLNLKHYIVLTGLNVDTPFDRKGPKTKFGTDWMYTNYPISTADRQAEYDLLTKSTLDWTLVRLPMIQLTDERKEIRVSLCDCLGDTISATDLAYFLIKQLKDVTYLKKAPFIANV